MVMAGLKGFEPLANGLRAHRSTVLSYRPTSFSVKETVI